MEERNAKRDEKQPEQLQKAPQLSLVSYEETKAQLKRQYPGLTDEQLEAFGL
jgi:hypothetical protein